jgi:hypothetical protein
LLQSYFGDEQRDFWRVFLDKRGMPCPLDDVEAWTAWFAGIMGQPPPPRQLSPEAEAMRSKLATFHLRAPSALNHLNGKFRFTEIVDVLCSLPSGKAADLQNLTCELLRFPAEEELQVLEEGTHDQPRSTAGQSGAPRRQGYIFEPLLRCVAWVVKQLTVQNIDASAWPRVLQVCKLIPVPKSGQASEPTNNHNGKPRTAWQQTMFVIQQWRVGYGQHLSRSRKYASVLTWVASNAACACLMAAHPRKP